MRLDEHHLRALLSIHALLCMTPSISRTCKLYNCTQFSLPLSFHFLTCSLAPFSPGASHLQDFESNRMIKEFLQPKEGKHPLGWEKNSRGRDLRAMEQPELSLGPSLSMASKNTSSYSSSECSDENSRRKRKQSWDDPTIPTSVELQFNGPLPLGWEQCLDLQSGRMYYLNRKTLMKSWIRPKEQKLDLELNISTLPSLEAKMNFIFPEETKRRHTSSGSMMAVVCANCHLFVMLCKSSPVCPNCKYMNVSPPSTEPTTLQKLESVKSLETLSLLH